MSRIAYCIAAATAIWFAASLNSDAWAEEGTTDPLGLRVTQDLLTTAGATVARDPVVTDLAAPETAVAAAGPLGEEPDADVLAEFESYVAAKNAGLRTIGVDEVVVRTVCRNLNVRIAQVDESIAYDQIYVEEGIFDLKITGLVEATRDEEPLPIDRSKPGASSLRESSESGSAGGEVGVSQLMTYGGVVELLFQSERRTTNNSSLIDPHYRSRAGIQFTQPLLRDFGPLVTQSRIFIAEYRNFAAAAALRQQVLENVSQAIQTYYELIFAVSNVEVLRVSLAQAQELLRVNTAKFKAGVLPELDVLQAEADVADRQQQVITALQEIETVSDQLKRLLAEIEGQREISLRPADDPQTPEYAIREAEFVREAVAKRPEIEQFHWQIQGAGLNRDVAENRVMPRLDFFTGYFQTAVDDQWRGSVQDSRSGEFGSWRVGMKVEVPLQNREARYKLSQAEKEVDKAFLQLDQVRAIITQQVRDAIRDVETNRQRIIVGKKTVEFNIAKVDTAMKRQAVGLATSFDVLAFQRDLSAARSGLLRSVIDYNKAIIELERRKGSLLQRLGIEFADGAAPPAAAAGEIY